MHPPAIKAYADEPGGAYLRQLPNNSVFLFETVMRFGDIPPGYFVTHVPGNAVVICVCSDQSKTVLLDMNARIERVI